MKSFLSNLNTRLMIIHFIAFWFFVHAFFTLAFLHDYSFLHLPLDRMLLLNDEGRIKMDKEFIRQAGNIGLLAAYLISWGISSKRNWHWVNSVIIFLLVFGLYNTGYLGWKQLHSIFQAAGKLFPSDSVGEYLTNGLIMLGLGLVILFARGKMRYIDRGNLNSVKGNKADRKAAKAKMVKS